MLRNPSRRGSVLLAICFLSVVSCWVTAISAAKQQDAKTKARASVQAAIQAFEWNNPGLCIELLSEAKKLDPDLLEARLYLGVALHTRGRYLEAAQELEQLLGKNPTHEVARLHLAVVLAMLYQPGNASEKNRRIAEQSIIEFRRVLEKDPNKLLALDAVGALLFQLAGAPYDPIRFEESKKHHLKHVDVRPEDPTPYYWVGVINWTLAYRGNAEMRAAYNDKAPKKVNDEDPLPSKVREAFVGKYARVVDEGVTMLKQAIERRPGYYDAMAYLNLLYRLKADQAASTDERKHYFKMADDLIDEIVQKRSKPRQSPPHQSPKGSKPQLLAMVDFEFPELYDVLLITPPAPLPPPPQTP